MVPQLLANLKLEAQGCSGSVGMQNPYMENRQTRREQADTGRTDRRRENREMQREQRDAERTDTERTDREMIEIKGTERQRENRNIELERKRR